MVIVHTLQMGVALLKPWVETACFLAPLVVLGWNSLHSTCGGGASRYGGAYRSSIRTTKVVHVLLLFGGVGPHHVCAGEPPFVDTGR